MLKLKNKVIQVFSDKKQPKLIQTDNNMTLELYNQSKITSCISISFQHVLIFIN